MYLPQAGGKEGSCNRFEEDGNQVFPVLRCEDPALYSILSEDAEAQSDQTYFFTNANFSR
jgi:hypothetical protein